jgi:hypothetical protein
LNLNFYECPSPDSIASAAVWPSLGCAAARGLQRLEAACLLVAYTGGLAWVAWSAGHHVPLHDMGITDHASAGMLFGCGLLSTILITTTL